jgi:hypothetical protein
MKRQAEAILCGIAAAVALSACASAGRSNDALSASMAISPEYQSLIDNAMGRTECHREAVTGSRVTTQQVCRTLMQRQAQHERNLMLIDQVRAKLSSGNQPLFGRSAANPTP